MTRTEVYQLRLTEQEKSQLARMAEERNISIAKLIRERVLGQSFPKPKKALARSSTAEQPPVKRQVEGSTPSAPVPGGVAGSTAGPGPASEGSIPSPAFDKRVKQLRASMPLPNAERVARTELGP